MSRSGGLRRLLSDEYRLVRAFLSNDALEELLEEVRLHEHMLRRIRGSSSLGPRYKVIGGDVIAQSCPRIAALSQQLVPIIGSFGGREVTAFSDRVRAMRIQQYEDREDGFRWHFDGHPFAAVITLENASDGATAIVSRPLSMLVKPLVYATYPFPQVFSSLPSEPVRCESGDMLVLRGDRVLHCGRSSRAGRRTILVFAFDVPGRRPPRLRNWFAKRVNYG